MTKVITCILIFISVSGTAFKMDLREPKKKRIGSHIKFQQHLPIYTESESALPVASELWPLYIGHFTGDCVMVRNTEENLSLYTMVSFMRLV